MKGEVNSGHQTKLLRSGNNKNIPHESIKVAKFFLVKQTEAGIRAPTDYKTYQVAENTTYVATIFTKVSALQCLLKCTEVGIFGMYQMYRLVTPEIVPEVYMTANTLSSSPAACCRFYESVSAEHNLRP
jgi:hypothetical protein